MSRSRITALLLVTIAVGFVGGALVSIGWLADPDAAFIRNGSQIVDVRPTGNAVALAAAGLLGAALLAVAAATGITAWVASLLNTAGLERKRWFVAIAVLGALNCGLLGVLAYVIAGPTAARRATTPAPAVTAASAS
jgi:hypothetical protein